MIQTSHSFKVVAGIVSASAALVLAGVWAPGLQVAASQGKSSVDCACDPPQAGRVDGEWCLTQLVYDANRSKLEVGGGDALCPQDGAPDDPLVRNAAIPGAGTAVRTYRIALHVLRERRGANPAASEAEVIAAMNTLNANYAPHKIQFVYTWRYLDETAYRYLDDNEVGMMKFKFAQSPATQLNVFVTKYNPGGSWGTFPWDPNALTVYGGIVLDQPHFTNPSAVLSHEVGHCLGLWHTFHGVSEVAACSDCYEQAGRSVEAGDTTGDKCSDTNPTPRNFNCAEPGGIDTCSQVPWTNTPLTNFMSYSLSCATEFTPQQSGRMHAWTTQLLSGWLQAPPPPAVPGTPALSTSGGIVTIVWADNSGDEDGFEVQREKKTSGNKWGSQTIVANVGADVTSTTNSPGTGTFRYRVRSYNTNGPSAWSGWTQIVN